MSNMKFFKSDVPAWIMIVCMAFIIVNCISVILNHYEMLPLHELYFENDYDENIYLSMSKFGLIINPLTVVFWIIAMVYAIKNKLSVISIFAIVIALLAAAYYTFDYYTLYNLESYYRARTVLDSLSDVRPWAGYLQFFAMILLSLAANVSVLAKILLIVTFILANLSPLAYLFQYLGCNELPNALIVIIFSIAGIVALCLKRSSQEVQEQ